MASHDDKGINTTLLAKNLSEINGLTDTSNQEITEDTAITLPQSVKLNNTKYDIKKDGTVIINNSILPKEYQQVEYIESTGTQYIDTKIYGITESDEIELIASYEENNEGTASMFGWDDGINYFDINLYHTARANHAEIAWGRNYKNTSNVLEKGIPHTICIKLDDEDLVLQIDSVEIGKVQKCNSNLNQSHGLFARFRNNEPRLYACSKVYKLMYWRQGVLFKYLIPCYSTTTVTDVDGIQKPKNTIGMYDTVEGKFYVNQGSGTFEKGNDV